MLNSVSVAGQSIPADLKRKADRERLVRAFFPAAAIEPDKRPYRPKSRRRSRISILITPILNHPFRFRPPDPDKPPGLSLNLVPCREVRTEFLGGDLQRRRATHADQGCVADRPAFSIEPVLGV